MEIIIGIVVIFFLFRIFAWFKVRSGGIYGMLIYNDDFLLKPYSKDDMALKNTLKQSNIINSELLIFKWFLIRDVINDIYEQGIKTDECEKIIRGIDKRMPKFFGFELKKYSDDDIENRFKFYFEKLSNYNEETSNEVFYLLTTGKLDGGLSYDMIGSTYFRLYYVKQFEYKKAITASLIKNQQYLKS